MPHDIGSNRPKSLRSGEIGNTPCTENDSPKTIDQAIEDITNQTSNIYTLTEIVDSIAVSLLGETPEKVPPSNTTKVVAVSGPLFPQLQDKTDALRISVNKLSEKLSHLRNII